MASRESRGSDRLAPGHPAAGLPATLPPGYGRRRALTRAEAQRLDREATDVHGVPGLVLMEHAARAVAEVAALLLEPGSQALVLCGPGNNGGDGYGVARFLASWGRRVEVLATHPPPTSGDAGWEVAAARAAGVRVIEVAAEGGALEAALGAGPGLLVDAIFGIGLVRPLAGPDQALLARLERVAARRLAVDVPTGLDCDTGLPLPRVLRADVTATMVAPKVGFAAAAAWVGHIVEIDIGLPPQVLPPLALTCR